MSEGKVDIHFSMNAMKMSTEIATQPQQQWYA